MPRSPERTKNIVWEVCDVCGRNIFRHYAWSHEQGTPPLDHDANPPEDSPNA